ncbi:MAG TPA: EAL domain-containing protein [Pseudolabrys sp.]|nr:EAL domain-containing protein [Pseudolabrys sp.]
MGSAARVFSRKNVIGIVAGVALAGAPLLAFNLWLGGLIDRQGQEEVETSAKRAMTLAESRVTSVIDALDDLAARGVDSCRTSNLDAMRAAAFATIPAKEFAVIAPDGQTLCTHLGLPLGQRQLIASEPMVGAPGYTLDIVQIVGSQHMVRLRRKSGSGPNSIAALVPSSLFLPHVSNQGGPFSAHASMVTQAGTPIGEAGKRRAGDDTGMFTARIKSDKFGFTAEVSLRRGHIVAGYADLERFGIFISAGIVLVLIVSILLMPRRTPGNPVAEMERALEAGEFVPYYQPIVDIRSGQLRGAEVLVRWRKPDGSLVYPGAFIPMAESSGLILEMTRDLMRRVCVEAGTALGCRPGLKISFNFAGKLFADESIVKDVRDIFTGSKIALSQVVLEVTERDPIENFTETRRIIAALQGIGVRIAIDDVGTGHSGLSYMLKLGVDIIKIDKMFVDAIGTDRNSTTIVETLIDLAHNMRMDVVAEGVENFEQVVHLRELGIRSAQGYVFAPPLPGSAFLQLVEAIDPLPVAGAEPKAAGAARGYIPARGQFATG